ncbi:MAG: hypothetical protein WB679_15890 [Terracidiphilus sp.]
MAESANKDCIKRHFEEPWNHGEVERIDDFFSTEFSNFSVHYSDVRGIIQHIIRYLQTLTEIGVEKNTTIVFPLPVEMPSLFKMLQPSAKAEPGKQ